MSFDPAAYLKQIPDMKDADVDLARAALALAALSQPDTLPERYLHHLEKLADAVKGDYAARLKAGDNDDANTKLASLVSVLAQQNQYRGDQETYDDLQNANLMRVIERRCGLPITLAILYIHAGRAQGWPIAGLNIPGHFVCRIDEGAQRLIFDPFDGGRELQASDLRGIIKRSQGPQAELSADYFYPATNTDILVRLQNNIKYRQIQIEDYKGALEIVQHMQLICPNDVRLLLEAGILYARTGQQQAAVGALEAYIARAPSGRDRQEAAILLRDIQVGLHER